MSKKDSAPQPPMDPEKCRLASYITDTYWHCRDTVTLDGEYNDEELEVEAERAHANLFRQAFRDFNISCGAKGLLICLCQLEEKGTKPGDWQELFRLMDRLGTDEYEDLYSYLYELTKAGYVDGNEGLLC